MKTINFNKHDNWDSALFFEIFEFKNEKYLRCIVKMEREANGHAYLDWGYTNYEDSPVKIEKLLEWNDIYYGMDQYCFHEDIIFCSPETAFKIANDAVKGKGDGSTFLFLTDVTLKTPCGYYYGW